MRDFCALYEQLDRSPGTTARVSALEAYLRAVDPADGAWALSLLLGKRRRRLITGRRLREIALAASALPEWLFDDCHAQVGDSAETIALLLPQLTLPEAELIERPLAEWMGERLPAIAALEPAAQARAVLEAWASLPAGQAFLFNKLLTGGLRVGVSTGLVTRALARVAGLEEAEIAQRLMGGFEPTADAFRNLLAPAAAGAAAPASRPFPFFLASPLDPAQLESWDPSHWRAEWKWDGIRGQLIRRAGGSFLWSRGEELVNESFPELVSLGEALPEGTVLDGEVIVWNPGEKRPEGFAALQRRLGRRSVGAALRRQCPMAFVAYDLLESGGADRRDEPLRQRLERLAELCAVVAGGDHPERQRLRGSAAVPMTSWEELERQRGRAREVGAEGLMLKRLESPYRAGRRRGDWWKHKLEPLHLDAVLLYAQAGSGRRANLHTDYTFGIWSRPPGSAGAEPQLMTFAKAYSGLDDAEIAELDRWIRRHTTERFGPVRAVEPLQVFELAFEGLQPSKRHKSGLAVRFPRIARWRRDKPAAEADSLATALRLLEGISPPG
ncbi:ATP-dependent DNA ligase [Synechococcus sp. CBW1107]|uniref:ATP-dependent DNA ligase n=1 Tax=Synechococcus sp. CBW1107 TaxID=2789857 RepID=UPI0018CF4760|nr:ATP-dependent DNA ligase [Synechococcus sp. CBW1107]QPN56907.1 ATP-dependent DNA ligase [Synechococcus sp. CBW1107]CAK6695400.1 DNA ligase [Synechococcus sp. CBW1107]